MDKFEDLSEYSGCTEHDMNVDYDYHINTGELIHEFAESDLDEYINNLNDWD